MSRALKDATEGLAAAAVADGAVPAFPCGAALVCSTVVASAPDFGPSTAVADGAATGPAFGAVPAFVFEAARAATSGAAPAAVSGAAPAHAAIATTGCGGFLRVEGHLLL
jgi:hypothetical protein